MSKIIIVIVLVVVVLLGWMYWNGGSQDQIVIPTSTVSQTTSTPAPTVNPAGGVSATDSSDAALDADVKSIDGNMNNLNADGASVDAGLKDQSTY